MASLNHVGVVVDHTLPIQLQRSAHIMMECVDFNDVRNKHFVASSFKDLFKNVEAQNITDFLKTVFIRNFNVFTLIFVILSLF